MGGKQSKKKKEREVGRGGYLLPYPSQTSCEIVMFPANFFSGEKTGNDDDEDEDDADEMLLLFLLSLLLLLLVVDVGYFFLNMPRKQVMIVGDSGE